MLKKILWTALILIFGLALVVGINTVRQGSRQIEVAPLKPVAVDANAAAERLAGAVRIPTISFDDKPDASAAEFVKLHAYLAQQFPKTHATLKRETIGTHTLLFSWPGRDPAAQPIMLMAHQDVVPVATGTEADWRAEPFAGTVRDGFVWGRGAWDDKGNLIGILEAVELLVAQGFQPRQTIYLAFGHDEEVGGERGAKQIAALLKSRGVRLEFVVDEGLLITDGVLKGLDKPLALIGVAEKGILNVALSASGVPGHSSMPPADTAIGQLSVALARVQARPMPAEIRGVAAEMLGTVAPEMSGAGRVFLSNLWLFGPLVKLQLERGPSSNAMLRTTTALTVVQGGNKVNVLPASAQAVVNFRLLPGDTQETVIAHTKQAVADPAVKVEAFGMGAEASPVSASNSPSYRLIARTVRELFPGTLVAPGLMIGATDSRHMVEVADQIYRFSPVRARAEDLPRFHGTNERIAIANHVELIAFYHRLLTAASEPPK